MGIVFSGFSASPAVIPTNSVPPNEKTTITNEKRNPCNPLAKKPPFCYKLPIFETPWFEL